MTREMEELLKWAEESVAYWRKASGEWRRSGNKVMANRTEDYYTSFEMMAAKIRKVAGSASGDAASGDTIREYTRIIRNQHC